MYIPRKIEPFSIWLKEKNASSALIEWAEDRSFPNFWTSCSTLDWMIWLLTKIGYKLSFFELRDFFALTEEAYKNYSSCPYLYELDYLSSQVNALKTVLPWSKISE